MTRKLAIASLQDHFHFSLQEPPGALCCLISVSFWKHGLDSRFQLWIDFVIIKPTEIWSCSVFEWGVSNRAATTWWCEKAICLRAARRSSGEQCGEWRVMMLRLYGDEVTFTVRSHVMAERVSKVWFQIRIFCRIGCANTFIFASSPY